jgi:hypothetical protein
MCARQFARRLKAVNARTVIAAARSSLGSNRTARRGEHSWQQSAGSIRLPMIRPDEAQVRPQDVAGLALGPAM